jgi:hypothetical protein
MARPQVFISSTYYDLRHIRASLERFVESLGYEPVLSEKGKIAYDPDLPLDQSCYRDASAADIFVLIVGGRYGSASSDAPADGRTNFYDRYESVTKKEYDAAVGNDKPVYILIDQGVFAEYETYGKNRGNDSVEYAHVDSVNVFKMLDTILAKRRNSPVHKFDRPTDIEQWLREQWAGLFRELMSRRSEQKQLASLTKQVDDLSVINKSLQRYMETIVSSVSPDEANDVIRAEHDRQASERQRREFEEDGLVKQIMELGGVSADAVEEFVREANSLEDFAAGMARLTGATERSILEPIRHAPNAYAEAIAETRAILGLGPLDFKTSSPNTANVEALEEQRQARKKAAKKNKKKG